MLQAWKADLGLVQGSGAWGEAGQRGGLLGGPGRPLGLTSWQEVRRAHRRLLVPIGAAAAPAAPAAPAGPHTA